MWVAHIKGDLRTSGLSFAAVGQGEGRRLGGGSGYPYTSWKARILLRGTEGSKGFWVKVQLSQHPALVGRGLCLLAPALELSPQKPRLLIKLIFAPCFWAKGQCRGPCKHRALGATQALWGQGPFGAVTGHLESYCQRLSQCQGLPLGSGNPPASPQGASSPFLDSA